MLFIFASDKNPTDIKSKHKYKKHLYFFTSKRDT